MEADAVAETRDIDLQYEDTASECADIDRIMYLGLGRGVDATDPTPWQNKTAFQVRPVTIENIIGTEGGGAVQSYNRLIINRSEASGQASASVTDPNAAVSIGVEAEYSQSFKSRYQVAGTKVLNRTISFKDDMLGSREFETWLCRWILKKVKAAAQSELKHEQASAQQRRSLEMIVGNIPMEDDKPIVEFTEDDYKRTMSSFCSLHLNDKTIIQYFIKFISRFHITHYVSSIELGASGYELLTENNVTRRLGLRGKVGVEQIAAGSATGSHSKSYSKKSRDIKKIGVIQIRDDVATVKRRSYDEAVIGIRIKPISDLITERHLRKSLQTALVRYTRKDKDIGK